MPNEAEALTALNIRLGALHEDVGEMKSVLNRLTEAITKLALIEQQQGQASMALERAFKTIEKVEGRCKEAEGRIAAIELQMPLVRQTSGWVERVVVALVGAALMFMAKQAGLFGGG